MKQAICLAVCFWIGVLVPAFAQSAPTTPTEITALATEFLDDVQAGRTNEAFQYAFKDAPGTIGSPNITNAAAQIDAALQSYGKVRHWSKIKSVSIANSFYREVFILDLDRIPLFFELRYFNGSKGWSITNVSFDTYESAKKKGYFDEN